jgi:hypothetical protein
MITAGEMTLEHTYLANKFRLHNRLLHGWGVVCGAQVCMSLNKEGTGAEPWKVRVRPGYILGPYGDEIQIDCERTVDVRTGGLTGVCGQPPGEVSDPWCSDVMVERREGPVYIAVRYEEFTTRPVRVQPVGCGCDDSQCENSRLRDGYEIKVLSRCPDSHRPSGRADYGHGAHSPRGMAINDVMKHPEGLAQLFGLFDCPPCPTDPWVVLAMVQVGPGGKILAIDNCNCRRTVVSTAPLWWQCPGGLQVYDETEYQVEQGAVGANVTVTISTQHLAAAYFPSGVTVTQIGEGVPISAGTQGVARYQVPITVNVAENAQPGEWVATLVAEDGSLATHTIKITRKPQPVQPVQSVPPAPPVPPVQAVQAVQPPGGQAPEKKQTPSRSRSKQ